jgi:AraC-like DNA-binding protein
MVSVGPADKVYPASKVAAIVQALAAEGVSQEEALRGVNVEQSALLSSETRVALAQVIQCYRNAARLSRQRLFAYQTGLRFHVSTYGMWGFAILSSTNFRQTMQFAVKYHALATPLAQVSFKESGEVSTWTMTPVSDPSVDVTLYRFIVELQVGTHISLHRDIMGPSFAPGKVQFASAPPSNVEEYVESIGCPVEFAQPFNAMQFDSAWLDREPRFGNAITYSQMSELNDELLNQLELQAGMAGRVRQLLLGNLMRPMSFAAIAKRLQLPARTLRRKLMEEGTSFRSLVDELRMGLSVKYLRDTSLTVEEIAHTLGFSEPTNFRQAFRRWTRVSPQKFRTDLVHPGHR